MVLPVDADFPQAGITTLEALERENSFEGYQALFLQDRASEAILRPLAEYYQGRLLLPEIWQEIFPQCGVLISSALSGGSFLQRLREAPRGRSWLYVEPMAAEFLLPCSDGQGRNIPLPQQQGFFSPVLLCQYAHFVQNNRGLLRLWDTEETLAKKVGLAKELGILGIVKSEE